LIKEVRGIGLLLGIELASDFAERCGLTSGQAPAGYLVEQLHIAGLLSIPSGAHTVRWLPPLNVSRLEIDEAVTILSTVLAGLVKG
jgi:acetylornithine/succinyldiaminopimelate/putrescine aminotransferase